MANEENKTDQNGENASGTPDGEAGSVNEAEKMTAEKYAKLRQNAEEMGFEGDSAVEDYFQFLEVEAAKKYKEENGGEGNKPSGEEKKPPPPEKKPDTGNSEAYKAEVDNIRAVASAAIIEAQYSQFMIENSARADDEKCPFDKKEMSSVLHKPGYYQMAHNIAREQFGDNIWKAAEFILATQKGASKYREQGKNASEALKNAKSTATTSDSKRQPGGETDDDSGDKQFVTNVFPDNRYKGEE